MFQGFFNFCSFRLKLEEKSLEQGARSLSTDSPPNRFRPAVNVIKLLVGTKFTFPDYWKRLSSAVLTWKKITIFQQILTQELFFVVKIAHSCCTSADWEGNLNFVPTKSFITLTAGLKRFGGESVERLRAPCSRLFSSSFSRKEQKLKNPWNTSEWVRLKFFFVCVDETFIYNRFSS